MIDVIPADTAVTSPEDDTDAMPALEEDHVTLPPLMTPPVEFSTWAVSCTVSPSQVSVSFAGVTRIDAGVGPGKISVDDSGADADGFENLGTAIGFDG